MRKCQIKVLKYMAQQTNINTRHFIKTLFMVDTTNIQTFSSLSLL